MQKEMHVENTTYDNSLPVYNPLKELVSLENASDRAEKMRTIEEMGSIIASLKNIYAAL